MLKHLYIKKIVHQKMQFYDYVLLYLNYVIVESRNKYKI